MGKVIPVACLEGTVGEWRY